MHYDSYYLLHWFFVALCLYTELCNSFHHHGSSRCSCCQPMTVAVVAVAVCQMCWQSQLLIFPLQRKHRPLYLRNTLQWVADLGQAEFLHRSIMRTWLGFAARAIFPYTSANFSPLLRSQYSRRPIQWA